MPSKTQRTKHWYSLRIEYAGQRINPFPLEPSDLVPGWHRDFEISDKTTLEQLSSTILQILDWDRDHLYEFRIGDRVHAGFGEDEQFVDVIAPCVSCDIPMHLLRLARTDTFVYVFDFGDCHTFRVTVLAAQPLPSEKNVPALLSYKGKNIIQYPGTMNNTEARIFQQKPPALGPLQPRRNSWRIRFVRAADRKILTEWRKSRDKTLWQKAVTVLENWNLLPEDIAKKVERPLCDIREWIKAFNRDGLEGLNPPRKPRIDAPKRKAALDQKRTRILEIFHDSPRSYGINRSNWNRPSLATAFSHQHNEPISSSTVGRLIKKSGYTMKKARKVLCSPDPEYREKVDLVLHTLQNLKPGELFFFVDELGPLRVKKYGGRTFVRKTEPYTLPQRQDYRGVITMAGALNAITNQVTWVYARSKDTSAMIDLIEILFNQHKSASKLYITWDAASWHRSGLLVAWLDTFNEGTERSGEGPLIHLVPLPTSSQFLDVIEAIFSGMKRAVIHHSNYRSEEEMKAAISRHFVERNEYFRANPKRAGKKIWDLDFFTDYESIRAGDLSRMVAPNDVVVIDLTFLLESSEKSFSGAPLIFGPQGQDNTVLYGVARDLLRLRNSVGMGTRSSS
jgi:transposase